LQSTSIWPTHVNDNIDFRLSLTSDSAVHTFTMCYLLPGEFGLFVFCSRCAFIFPSLAMGSFKLTMIPCSAIFGFHTLFH
jgi:hypothetical protein